MQHKWYLSQGGSTQGLMNLEQARRLGAKMTEGYAWREGFVSWQQVAHVVELARHGNERLAPPAPPPEKHAGCADEVDYVIHGDGMAFLHAGGRVAEKQLSPGEVLHVDTGCLVAIEPTVDFDLQQVGGIKSALFGGEGLFFARLRGPGRVWLQSLPFSRMAGRMLAAAPAGSARRAMAG